jgi:hypothetical protein
VVDGGINAAHLRDMSQHIDVDPERSWVPSGDFAPGELPLRNNARHGTMCAFAVGLAAPEATLLDYAILQQEQADIDTHLSDALTAYLRLIDMLREAEGEHRPLVISNSWGLVDCESDDGLGPMGRYRDRVEHPFNGVVATIEDEFDVDVLFAAGNSGLPCPEYGWPADEPMITGAGSLPSSICVGAVDLNGERAGYSAVGPGALTHDKPDLMGYAHYSGSKANGPADTGTSTACPVIAGVVAAVRSKIGPGPLRSARLRDLLRASSSSPGQTTFDPSLGSGIIRPMALLTLLDERFGRLP